MVQLNTEGMKQRKTAIQPNGKVTTQSSLGNPNKLQDDHPAGPVKHGGPMQALRIFLFTIFFTISCIFIHGAQLLGLPLYFYNRDYFYAYMAVTKQYFGLLATVGTQWWSPTVIRVSGDSSVSGQLKQLADGRLELDFPERIVLIANHQIYTDWLYLWWASYTAGLHGHIYIILKESLKYVPVIGPAMMLYNFIFMARKWEKDQPRLRHRLEKLNTRHSGPMSGSEGSAQLDPMWLLIFPEGTNLSRNTRNRSAAWSAKSGTPDVKHGLLPRSTGLQFCLSELKDTVEYLYDCTICYEGTSPGQLASEIFTLRAVYFEGRPPKSVNLHWRRFKVSDIPVDDHKAMEEWLLKRWQEKDEIIDYYQRTGRLPADPDAVRIAGKDKPGNGYIETEVKPKSQLEFCQIFTPVLAAAFVGNILVKMVNLVTAGKLHS
ncbi:hypothetical protein AAFC00_002859 [Neodothiora populina]|uniref:Phospholipid/glycerol acyltransferase domain-containing protein n=1 Tax=Neodothiora populina TaxID=2781224 RepID=A0ABR3P8S1_9PEZI